MDSLWNVLAEVTGVEVVRMADERQVKVHDRQRQEADTCNDLCTTLNQVEQGAARCTALPVGDVSVAVRAFVCQRWRQSGMPRVHLQSLYTRENVYPQLHST